MTRPPHHLSKEALRPSHDLYDRIFTPQSHRKPVRDSLHTIRHSNAGPTSYPFRASNVAQSAQTLRSVKSATTIGEAKRNAWYASEVKVRPHDVQEWEPPASWAHVPSSPLVRQQSPTMIHFAETMHQDVQPRPAHHRQRTISTGAPTKSHPLLMAKRWSGLLRGSKENSGSRSPASSSSSTGRGPNRFMGDHQPLPSSCAIEISSPYAVTGAPGSALMNTVAAVEQARANPNPPKQGAQVHHRLRQYRSMESSANEQLLSMPAHPHLLSQPSAVSIVPQTAFSYSTPSSPSSCPSSIHLPKRRLEELRQPLFSRSTSHLPELATHHEDFTVSEAGDEAYFSFLSSRHTAEGEVPGRASSRLAAMSLDEEAYMSIAVGESSKIYTSSLVPDSSFYSGDTWSTPNVDGESSSFECNDVSAPIVKNRGPPQVMPTRSESQKLLGSYQSQEGRLQSYREFAIHSPQRRSLSDENRWPERDIEALQPFDGDQNNGDDSVSHCGEPFADVAALLNARQTNNTSPPRAHHARLDFLRQQEKFILPPVVDTRCGEPSIVTPSPYRDDGDMEIEAVEQDAPADEATYDSMSPSEHDTDRAEIRTAWRGRLDGLYTFKKETEPHHPNHSKTLRRTRVFFHPTPRSPVQ